MSFLIGRASTRLPLAARSTQVQTARCFATSPISRKSATETAQETLEQAKQKAGELGTEGAEKGKTATEKIKDAIGLGAKETQRAGEDAKSAAEGAATQAKRTAEDAAAEAKRKAGS